MGGKNTILTKFALAGTKNGTISVSHLEEPYGNGSFPVVSIGISLKSNAQEPDWKAHIPYENIDELINALKDAKEHFNTEVK
ncbi:hypothetical protein [Sulfurospirillum barnesii]|uniref:Uncharacterized protein n=1 Tax=Sulfurospirillum barnesii (strain ATCC 700032 / DSM 10660 / SES-3) TaxID=760154 RepID=I3XXC9_SULBS|nr:hypothetical protein [Sulfurospirillum barnesii]AFL68603.1 hypothetical protein Sulba_1311 [Sulfurospirillum barnesii SES-3]